MLTRGNLGKNIKRIGLIAALGVGMLMSLAACGGTDSTGQTGEISAATATPEGAMVTVTDTPAMAEAPTQVPSDTGGSATATPASQGSTGSGTTTEVQGTLREWAIDLSQKEVPAGKVRFTVTNAGMMPHNFTVTDSSGKVAGTPVFASSDGPQTLEVDLKAGTYTIICSLPGHAARGQTVDLVVK